MTCPSLPKLDAYGIVNDQIPPENEAAQLLKVMEAQWMGGT
jgi:hypothetical protein